MKRLLIFIVFLVVLVTWFVMSTVGPENVAIQPSHATTDVIDALDKDSVKTADSTARLYNK